MDLGVFFVNVQHFREATLLPEPVDATTVARMQNFVLNISIDQHRDGEVISVINKSMYKDEQAA